MKTTKTKYILANENNTIMISDTSLHKPVKFKLDTIHYYMKEKNAQEALEWLVKGAEKDINLYHKYVEQHWRTEDKELLAQLTTICEQMKSLKVKKINITWEMEE